MIPAALLCVIVSGCANELTTAATMVVPPVAREASVPFNKFFVAWSQTYSSSPIQTQTFGVDTRQARQWAGLWADQSVLNFASANRGGLYVNADEPDQYCIAPADYAGIYHDFVASIRAVDPTARVSPAGFAEPNERCCPDPADAPCRVRVHSVGYADQFYNAYVQRYGVAPPVNEWRFHDFGISFAAGDVAGWWARVDKEASWSVAHGANMVLGGWGFHGWNESPPVYQEHLKQAMGRLVNDTRINEAVYWSYEMWQGERNYLANDDGSLTSAGQTYANPLTDVPTDVGAVASANGQAMIQWNNTTSAWSIETEVWVMAPGSASYVYKNTERVAGPGATQAPFSGFNIGDNVKARVRYYNVYGQAAWSPFSNAVSITLGGLGGNKGTGSRKSPRFCFLPVGSQGQPCE